MLEKTLFFSMLFYFSGVISMVLGVYNIYIFKNKRTKLNAIFIGVIFSLSLWSFGFSQAIIATNIQYCLLWRRISAIGWGSIYAIILHFTLVLTKKDRILKVWWTYIIIYLPAFITVYVYALSTTMSTQQYKLELTDFGWTNLSINNSWDWFFNIYYMVYIVVSITMMWLWSRQSKIENERKQGQLIVISFLSAFILGTGIDMILNSYNANLAPQIAPIIIQFPVIMIYFSMIRYGLMNDPYIHHSKSILKESDRSHIYNRISAIIFLASFICYIIYGNFYHDWISPILPSSFILILGLAIHLIKYSKLMDYIKDVLLVLSISLTIPVMTLMFYDFGGISIWSVIFIFIAASSIFNKRIVVLTITVSAVSTQIFMWVTKPRVYIEVAVDASDYIGRIIVILVATWLVSYVNKLYINHLNENEEQLVNQRFISEISSDFITADEYNIEEKTNWLCRILGKLHQTDYVSIITFDRNKGIFNSQKIWNRLKSHDLGAVDGAFSLSTVKWINNLYLHDEIIYIPDRDNLPNVADDFKDALKRLNIKTSLCFSIKETNATIKFIEFSTAESKVWSEEELRLIRIVSNIITDAHARVNAEKEIRFMAYHDHLTGLPNVRLFKDRIGQSINHANRNGSLISVIFLDLDSFKDINDTLGHAGGDQLLQTIASKLTSIVRKSDTVARFGGDEFLIMLDSIDELREIPLIVQNIMEEVNQPILVQGQEYNLSFSAGVSIYPYDGKDMDTLIKNADIALYKAKEQGKSQFILCTTELKENVRRKINLNNALYKALDRNELYLNYQPQINLKSGKIIGLEALIRWQHPQFGFVSPAEFIPIAEQNGLINQIGAWVLKSALLQNKKWQDKGYEPITMAINISGIQLKSPSFLRIFKKVLSEIDIDHKYIEVEVTESTVMSETKNIASLLNELRNLGVMISIDDFGTDYSSLSRLKELPIDKLKIDKQFIDGIEFSDKDKAIVRTIIGLSKNLDLITIAEGVEDEHQLQFLEKEFCDEIQGYYYYKPMDADSIEKLLVHP